MSEQNQTPGNNKESEYKYFTQSSAQSSTPTTVHHVELVSDSNPPLPPPTKFDDCCHLMTKTKNDPVVGVDKLQSSTPPVPPHIQFDDSLEKRNTQVNFESIAPDAPTNRRDRDPLVIRPSSGIELQVSRPPTSFRGVSSELPAPNPTNDMVSGGVSSEQAASNTLNDADDEAPVAFIPEATLVGDVVIAEPIPPWWKQTRAKIFLAVMLAVITVMAVDFGVTVSSQQDEPPPTTKSTIVETCLQLGLEWALTAAMSSGLDLTDDGPHTVFGPTNKTFEALGPTFVQVVWGTPPLLTYILEYHIVDINILTSVLSDGDMIETLNGALIEVTIDRDGVKINNALIVNPDNVGSNGVVHVINAVLFPHNVIGVALGLGLSGTASAVFRTDLVEKVTGAGPLTIFAPTDKAFQALGQKALETLINDADAMADILKYHIVDGSILSSDVSNSSVVTLKGASIEVVVDGDIVMVNDAMVVNPDNIADNGIVHVIDTVLTPPQD